MAHKIVVVTIGKNHDSHIKDAIATYEQRIRPLKIEWRIIPPKTEATIQETIASESKAIMLTLASAEYTCLLDERGIQLTSEAFSSLLFEQLGRRKNIYFVIGGAYGVSQELRERANVVLSLSKMVFPHQLVRLLLAEQLYRAQSIAAGSKYHHGNAI